MTTEHTCWPDEFETVLRQHLPLLGGVLSPATSLPEAGLDSLATVVLLVTLEQEFDVMIPDDRLVIDSFATAGGLWTMMVDVITATRGGL